MKAIFCTLATGSYYEQGGTANLIKSTKHFHPDIPFKVYGDKEMEEILSNYQKIIEEASYSLPEEIRPSKPYPPLEMGFYHAFLGMELCKEYDLVIYIDCDSLIVAPLTEVFDQEYDIAGVRNIADNGKAGYFEAKVDGLDPLKYINGGFTASRHKDFWSHWILLNLKLKDCAYLAEQYTLNILFHSGIYNTLLLDPPDSGLYYGIASAYGEKTHWDSWQRIVIEDNYLKLDGKVIKILHEAGGIHLPKMDLDGDLLPKNVSEFIKKEILCTESSFGTLTKTSSVT